MHNIMNPPIAWRFFIVYRRFPDGRMCYFRGQHRRKLFIRDDKQDWVWTEERARLFELDQPDLASDRSYAKALRNDVLRHQIHCRGFDGTVFSSHLIIPAKTRKEP